MALLLYAAFWAAGIAGIAETHGTNRGVVAAAFVTAHLLVMLGWWLLAGDSRGRVR